MTGRGASRGGGGDRITIPRNVRRLQQTPLRTSSRAAIHGIRHRVPQDFPTIQSAINAASDGDTVLVAEGTYLENIRYRGKAIVVGSLYLIDGDSMHIDKTIIDGSRPSHPDSGSVVSFIDGEDTTSVLCGLTIRAGTGTLFLFDGDWGPGGPLWVREGGGVYCNMSGPRLVRNMISHNRVISQTAQGGGVGAIGSQTFVPYLIIERNRILENYVRGDSVWTSGYSAGIDLCGASARVQGNVVERDTVEGTNFACGGGMSLTMFDFVSPLVDGEIRGNTFRVNVANATHGGGTEAAVGAGVLLFGTAQVIFEENLFDGNIAYAGKGWAEGGGMCIDDHFSPDCGTKFLAKNRFVNNQAQSNSGWSGGSGLDLYVTRANVVANDIVQNNALGGGGGNGGGVHIESSAFRLQGNVIANNFCNGGSGGINVGHAPLTPGEQIVANNSICNNRAGGWGGGVDVWEVGEFTMRNNLIRGNTAGQGAGGINLGSNAPVKINVENNLITWNSAPAVGGINAWGYCIQSFVNNTIVGNLSTTLAGGMIVWNYVDLRFINNIVWNNRCDEGVGQLSASQGLPGYYYNNDIMGGWSQGSGNFSLVPQFVDTSYRLSDVSPCIGVGIDSVLIGGRWVYPPSDDFSGLRRPDPPGSSPDVGARENPLPIGMNAPALSVMPLSWDFRNVQPGTASDTIRVAIRNRKLMPLQVIAVTTRRAEFSIAGLPVLPLTIPPLREITLSVLFSPVQAGTTVADTIVVTAGDSLRTTAILPVCGRGSAPVVPAICDVAYTLHPAGGEIQLSTIDLAIGSIKFVSGFSPHPPSDVHGITIRECDQMICVSHSTPSLTTLYRLSTEEGDLECLGTLPLGSVKGIFFTRGDTLILSDSTGRLFGMKTLTSSPFLIDSSGIPILSFALSPTTGQLWGISHYGLYTIDRSTWHLTLVGTFPGVLYPSIAFGRLGTLYGLLDGELVRLDKVTGAPTQIGSTGNAGLRALVMQSSPVNSTEGGETDLPHTFALHQNYPNPFNPSTTIEFDLPSKCHVDLNVYDVLGRLVSTLAEEDLPGGRYSRVFNAAGLASGVYFVQIRSGSFISTRNLLLLR